eukprot:CAMPEP_0174880450 /NCGR_PEP_ID=MMETSP1114-20130205/83764_1 /TAXON_ID=312471 /ORGANISM="Neobodo designis, Strain CCAP 1951/1" /LENGTH=1163 /DNA_ID=CAMNT_0016115845 /DNA_START=25 /DNA_END=3513 /DNA_ORIENTATION=-
MALNGVSARADAARAIQRTWRRHRAPTSTTVTNDDDLNSAGALLLHSVRGTMWRPSGNIGSAQRLNGHLLVHVRQVLDLVSVQAAFRALGSSTLAHTRKSRANAVSFHTQEERERDAIVVQQNFAIELLRAKFVASATVAQSIGDAQRRRQRDLDELCVLSAHWISEYSSIVAVAATTAVRDVATLCECFRRSLVFEAEIKQRVILENTLSQGRMHRMARDFVEVAADKAVTLSMLAVQEASARASLVTRREEFLRDASRDRGAGCLERMESDHRAVIVKNARQASGAIFTEALLAEANCKNLVEFKVATARILFAAEAGSRQCVDVAWSSGLSEMGASNSEQLKGIAERHEAAAAVARCVVDQVSMRLDRDCLELEELESRKTIQLHEVSTFEANVQTLAAQETTIRSRHSAACRIQRNARCWLAKARVSEARTNFARLCDAQIFRETIDFFTDAHAHTAAHALQQELRAALDAQIFRETIDFFTDAHAHACAHALQQDMLLRESLWLKHQAMMEESMSRKEMAAAMQNQRVTIGERFAAVETVVSAIIDGAVRWCDALENVAEDAEEQATTLLKAEADAFDTIIEVARRDRCELEQRLAASVIVSFLRRAVARSQLRCRQFSIAATLVEHDEFYGRAFIEISEVDAQQQVIRGMISAEEEESRQELINLCRRGEALLARHSSAARTLQKFARRATAQATVKRVKASLARCFVETDESAERSYIVQVERGTRRDVYATEGSASVVHAETSDRADLCAHQAASRTWIHLAELEAREDAARFHLARAASRSICNEATVEKKRLHAVLLVQAGCRSQLSRVCAVNAQDSQRTLDPSTCSLFDDEAVERLAVLAAEAEIRADIAVPWLAFRVGGGSQMEKCGVEASTDCRRLGGSQRAALETRAAYASSTPRHRNAFRLLDTGYRRLVPRTSVLFASGATDSGPLPINVPFVAFVRHSSQIDPTAVNFVHERVTDRLPLAAQDAFKAMIGAAQAAVDDLHASLSVDRLEMLGQSLSNSPVTHDMHTVLLTWATLVAPHVTHGLAADAIVASCSSRGGCERLLAATRSTSWLDVTTFHLGNVETMRQSILRCPNVEPNCEMLLQDVKRWAIALCDLFQLFCPPYTRAPNLAMSRPSTAARSVTPASAICDREGSPSMHKPVRPPTGT